MWINIDDVWTILLCYYITKYILYLLLEFFNKSKIIVKNKAQSRKYLLTVGQTSQNFLALMNDSCPVSIGLITISWRNSHQSHECKQVHMLLNVYVTELNKKKRLANGQQAFINKIQFGRYFPTMCQMYSRFRNRPWIMPNSGGKRFQHALYLYWTNKKEYGNSIR